MFDFLPELGVGTLCKDCEFDILLRIGVLQGSAKTSRLTLSVVLFFIVCLTSYAPDF